MTPPHYTNQFSNSNNFLWICWFLGKNLSNFVPPAWKLDYPYYHIVGPDDLKKVNEEKSTKLSKNCPWKRHSKCLPGVLCKVYSNALADNSEFLMAGPSIYVSVILAFEHAGSACYHNRAADHATTQPCQGRDQTSEF